MSNRNQNILQLRPQIPTIIEENITSPAEQFQNKTLRPILKFQNDLILSIFKQYTVQRKNIFPTLSDKKKLEYIENCIRKDLKFRSLMIGCIVGQFTLEEWSLYVEDESELRKRLVNMLVERVKDNVVSNW